MTTIQLKGAVACNWIAEQMVRDRGPEQALESTCGPMRKAVEQVIADQAQQPKEPTND